MVTKSTFTIEAINLFIIYQEAIRKEDTLTANYNPHKYLDITININSIYLYS